jgi:hypothetical protein
MFAGFSKFILHFFAWSKTKSPPNWSGRCSAAQELYDRHSAVLEQLNVIGHLSRTIRNLTVAEHDALGVVCTQFGVVCRASYQKGLIVKGHIVEAPCQLRTLLQDVGRLRRGWS